MEKLDEEVVFLPTHTTSNPRTGKVFTVETHHQRVELANPGDNGFDNQGNSHRLRALVCTSRVWIRTACCA
eukprot:7740966-Karenia_brevis.AAC.1